MVEFNGCTFSERRVVMFGIISQSRGKQIVNFKVT